MSLNNVPFMQPLLWAAYISLLICTALDWWEGKRKPYQQMLFAAKGNRAREGSRKDSRGLLRAIRIMDRGARIMHVNQSYWDKLDRRLAMMGEKAGAREMTAILLLRSLLISLPILALPMLWSDLRIAAAYPVAVALLYRQEMKALGRKFTLWQQELARGIPEVIDHLRICFAGGRDYLSALRQAQASGSPAIGRALSRLILDIQSIGSVGAFRLFSVSFDLPAIQKLASALMLAVESGYGAAEAYFSSIEDELTALRQEAAESLIRAKPEKIYHLYALLFLLAVAALLLKGWEILNQVGRLFM
jgi:hypothetical protein